MPHTLTVYDESKQYKADLHAFHDYAFFYADIGCRVEVYKLAKTRDVWGSETTDWISADSTIFITNTYHGSTVGSPAPGGAPPAPPGSGGGPSLTKSGQYRGTSGVLKEWATGILSVTIQGEITSGGAILDISSVDSQVSVAVDGRRIEGRVSASNVLTENSIW